MAEKVFHPELYKGKSVFITGGATGICFGIALRFLNYGAKVTIVSRKLPNIEKAVKQLCELSKSDRAFGTTCDVRKTDEVDKAVKFALEKMGSIDVLVNGAAGNFLVPFQKLSVNAFKTVLDIDTLGTFVVSKVVYDNWLKQHGGVIINISASLYYNGTALQTHSGTAKAGVDAITKHLAVQLGPRKIRVVGICPGPIQGTEGMGRLSPGEDVNFANILPAQRLGKREDIADAALFLGSEAASYITGTTLIVDGGQYLTAPNFTFLSKAFVENYPKL